MLVACVGHCGFYRAAGCGDTECLGNPASIVVISFCVSVVDRDNYEPTACKFGSMIGQAGPNIHLVLAFVASCENK